MREYHLPDGTPIPADLQEVIAADVRAFDAAQEPDARAAVALRKIGNELPRIRAVLAGTGLDQTVAHRRAVAEEIQALVALGVDRGRVMRTPQAHVLLRRYDLADDEGNFLHE